MKRSRSYVWVGLILLVICLGALPLVSACAPKEEAPPGPHDVVPAEKVKIVIGCIPNTTGAYAATQALVPDCDKMVFDYINEIEYIPGVEIVYKWLDGGTDTDKAVAAYKRFKGMTPKPVIQFVWSTGHALALADQFKRDKMVHVTPAAVNPFIDPEKWIFIANADYPSQAGAQLDWFLSQWKGASPPKLAELTWDNTFGRGFVTPEFIAYAKSKGVEVVAREYIPMAPSDTSAHLLRIKKAGADLAIGGMYASPLAVILKDMDKLGMIGDLTIGMPWPSAADELIGYVGPLANGVIHVNVFQLKDGWSQKAPNVYDMYTSSPANTELIDQMDPMVFGCCLAHDLTAVEIIKIAAETVGPENVDGQACYDAATKIKDFTMWGIGVPITFSATKHLGGDAVNITQIQDEKVVYVAEDLPVPKIYEGGPDVPK